ncbi:MAG TPA: DUF6152 family protein [Vicinamibacterales bacterium]|jgi:hypothetical protein
MRRSLFRIVAGAVVACLVSASALAHHGAASIYDMSKETTLKATVTEYVWTNPHVEVGVSTSGGTTTELLLELGSPPNIRNRGWTSRTVKPGDVVTVTFHPGLRGAKIGVVIKLVTADGKELHA